MPKKEEETTTVLQEYKNISNHAHTEINSIYSVFKLVLTIGSIMLTIIAGFGAYFTFFSIKDFKTEISGIRTDAHIEISRLKSETRGTVKTLKEEVQNRIDKELNEDSIRTIIAEKITDKVLDKTIITRTNEINKKNEVLSDFMKLVLKPKVTILKLMSN